MADSPTTKTTQDRDGSTCRTSPSTIALEELRHLLLAPEQAELGTLKERLDQLKIEPAEVAQVLSEAIRLRGGENSDLRTALAPIIGDNFKDRFPKAFKQAVSQDKNRIAEVVSPLFFPTVKEEFQKEFPKTFLQSVKANPDAVADAVYPILLPAIKKLVQKQVAEVKELVQSQVAFFFQSEIGKRVQAINQANSPFRRLQWGLQSLWTGRSYEEVRNAHLLARVKVTHVFLIHSKSGLLISHVSSPGEPEIAEDTVASMFAGIKTIFQKVGEKIERPSEIVSGENLSAPLEILPLTVNTKVVLAKGGHAYLAVVLQGTPFDTWLTKVSETMNVIDQRFGEKLENFRGNLEGFEDTQPHLEELLTIGPTSTKPKQPLLKWAIMGVLTILALIYFWPTDTAREKFVKLVDQEKKKQTKLFITAVDEEDTKFIIQGLHDPSLTHESVKITFENLAKEAGLPVNAIDLRIVPFLTLSTEHVEGLAKALLQPPHGVTLSITSEGKIDAAGLAPRDWISHFQQTAQLIPGISNVNIDKLQDESLESLKNLRDSIENFQVMFPPGTSGLTDTNDPAIDAIAQNINALNSLARELDTAFTIEIQGHASQEGSEQLNDVLSLRRATSVSQAFGLGPLSHITILTVAKGESTDTKSNKDEKFSNNRRVSVRVIGQSVEDIRPK